MHATRGVGNLILLQNYVIINIMSPDVYISRIKAEISRISIIGPRMLWVTRQQKATRKQATQMKNDNKVCG